MPDYKVVLPEENWMVVEFTQDNLPGIAVINAGLKGFEPKVVFGWHCSIMVQFNDLIDNGMPSRADRDLIQPFEDLLAEELAGESKVKPNAIYLGRITWNASRELIYRVFKPEAVNDLLLTLIEEKDYPLPFDFRMEPDQEWALAAWHLDNC